ncbi:MAG TPA: DinB family protein [Rubricoccaceae bacterium]|nr:DinB family protein [Rubricoccaceae bacterium]
MSKSKIPPAGSPLAGPATLADRLAALHNERDAFLDALARLAPAERTATPAPGKWSPVEIAEHVYRVEAVTLRGLERQLAAGDARRDVGPHSRAGVVLLLAAMRSPKQLEMPGGARGIAPEGMGYEAVRAAWAELPARWDAAVASFPPALERTPLLRHPVAGALTLDDALRFLAAHTSRHRRQLARAARGGSTA